MSESLTGLMTEFMVNPMTAFMAGFMIELLNGLYCND